MYDLFNKINKIDVKFVKQIQQILQIQTCSRIHVQKTFFKKGKSILLNSKVV